MRWGVVTTSYPRTDEDSAGHFVASLNRWLNSVGVDVEVVAAAADRSLFYRGGAPQALADLRRWPEALDFSLRQWRRVAEAARRWDAVVSHWLVPSALIADRLGLPHVTIAHGSDIALLRKLPLGASIVRHLAQRADLIYVADALRIEGAVGRTQPMGVELSRVQGGRATRCGLRMDRKVVLVMGRLVEDKGIDRAVRVVQSLPDDVILIIAGEGPERARLAAAASERVLFVGAIGGEPKRDLLARADVLLVPSRTDGAPTVIAEAAAVGLPIVATAVGGIAELGALVGPRLTLINGDRTQPGGEAAICAGLAAGVERALTDGRGAPSSPGSWPDQAAVASAIFAPLLKRMAHRVDASSTSNCCRTVTERL